MKTEAIILTSDLHFDKNNIDEIIDICSQLLFLCNERRIKKIAILGDLFTNRTGQNLLTLLALRSVLKQAPEYGVEDIYMFAGNHDKTNQESLNSYLDMFSDIPTVTVFRKQKTFLLTEDIKISVLPYFKENGSYVRRLKELVEGDPAKVGQHSQVKTKFHYLLTHVAFNGAVNNDGTKVTKGISLSLLDGFTKVFTGHYHNRMKINDKIFYIGSPLPHNFGEDNDKGFIIIHDNGRIELVEAKFKRNVKIKIDLSESSLEEVRKLKEKYKDSKNENVRFVLSGNDEELLAFDVNEFSMAGIEIKKENKKIIRAMNEAEQGKFVEFGEKEILKSFLEYCKYNEIDGETRKMGLNYLKIK